MTDIMCVKPTAEKFPILFFRCHKPLSPSNFSLAEQGHHYYTVFVSLKRTTFYDAFFSIQCVNEM